MNGNKLLFFWREIKSSFWFLPSLIILIAICFAFGLIYLDNYVSLDPKGIARYAFSGSVQSARTVLSTISGAMITVAGTVFSITLVALALAASQFGSRILRSFMTQRINQVVLGSYIATYVYTLIVLNSISDTMPVRFVPVISVAFAIIVTIANIILLIIFIHHIAVSIQADHIIAEITRTFFNDAKYHFAQTKNNNNNHGAMEESEDYSSRFAHQVDFSINEYGYLQDINYEKIFDFAVDHHSLIVLNKKPGDFLVNESKVGCIYSNEIIAEEKTEELKDAIIIGKLRTPQQDAEYSIQQIVQIAVRALSPSINDPFTAITCIHNLTSILCYLTGINFPSGAWHDENGKLRIILQTLQFEDILNASFNQIKNYSPGNPVIFQTLMDSLNTIYIFSQSDEQRDAIRQYAFSVLSLADKTIKDENDLNALRKSSSGILNPIM